MGMHLAAGQPRWLQVYRLADLFLACLPANLSGQLAMCTIAQHIQSPPPLPNWQTAPPSPPPEWCWLWGTAPGSCTAPCCGTRWPSHPSPLPWASGARFCLLPSVSQCACRLHHSAAAFCTAVPAACCSVGRHACCLMQCFSMPAHQARLPLLGWPAGLLALAPTACAFCLHLCRIEHPQELINQLQYGADDAGRVLRGKGPYPVAEYRLAAEISAAAAAQAAAATGGGKGSGWLTDDWYTPLLTSQTDGDAAQSGGGSVADAAGSQEADRMAAEAPAARGVYSFCMCPGELRGAALQSRQCVRVDVPLLHAAAGRVCGLTCRCCTHAMPAT